MNTEKIRKQFIIVKCLVVDKLGRILFVRRQMEEHKEAHNKWEFPGGKVEFSETPEDTAVRETKEESGYDVEIDYLLPKILSSKWESEESEAQKILICYVGQLIGGEQRLGDHGVNEIRWFSGDNIPSDSECLPGTIDFFKLYTNRTKDNK